MTKIKKAKYQICKRFKHNFKNLWNDNKATNFKAIKPGKRQSKTSFYAYVLDAKQIFKRFYLSVSEKKFKKNLSLSIKSLSRTYDNLIKSFEIRLDCVLYRSKLFQSIRKARQFISHGLVLVNSKKVVFSNKRLQNLDLIQIKKKMHLPFLNVKDFNVFFDYYWINQPRPIHLEIDYQFLALIFVFDCVAIKVYKPIKVKNYLIARFYS